MVHSSSLRRPASGSTPRRVCRSGACFGAALVLALAAACGEDVLFTAEGQPTGEDPEAAPAQPSATGPSGPTPNSPQPSGPTGPEEPDPEPTEPAPTGPTGPSSPTGPTGPSAPALDAEVVSVNIPSTLVCGVHYPAKVVMKNTGALWQPADVSLGMVYGFSPFAVGVSGVGLPLPGGFPVPPGSNVAFEYTLYHANTNNLTSSAHWQMSSAAAGLFGEAVAAPVTATCGSVPPQQFDTAFGPCAETPDCWNRLQNRPGPVTRITAYEYGVCWDPVSCPGGSGKVPFDDPAAGARVVHVGDRVMIDSNQKNASNQECLFEAGPIYTVIDPNGAVWPGPHPANAFGTKIRADGVTRFQVYSEIWTGSGWLRSNTLTYEVRP